MGPKWADLVKKADEELATMRAGNKGYWTRTIYVDGGHIFCCPDGQVECYENLFISHPKNGDARTFKTGYDAERWLVGF